MSEPSLRDEIFIVLIVAVAAITVMLWMAIGAKSSTGFFGSQNSIGGADQMSQKMMICIESDKGKNYYKKGYVTPDRLQRYKLWDSCIDSKRLKEYFCLFGMYPTPSYVTYTCPSACNGGFCAQTCGDGVKEGTEQCDDGQNNRLCTTNASITLCSPSCKKIYCGPSTPSPFSPPPENRG